MFASIERALSSARVNSTVKLWRWNGQTYASDRTLRDSQMTVWAVLELDDGSLLAGSADKQIRLYVDGTLLKAFVGHTDCVRAHHNVGTVRRAAARVRGPHGVRVRVGAR
jgi:hypothetical protein